RRRPGTAPDKPERGLILAAPQAARHGLKARRQGSHVGKPRRRQRTLPQDRSVQRSRNAGRNSLQIRNKAFGLFKIASAATDPLTDKSGNQDQYEHGEQRK